MEQVGQQSLDAETEQQGDEVHTLTSLATSCR